MRTDSYTFANGRHFGKQKLKRKTFCFQLVFVFLVLILSRYLLLAGSAEVHPGMSNSSNEVKKQQRNLKIAHLNVGPIKNREHYILAKELAIKNKLDILTISESWLDNTVTDIEVEIPGYI